ncbi:NUDIX hydrolase N-terminal domain-containing protein [Halogeometricum sp. CBA1124]|uniref:NUDIX hydrolase N-terminal domain-containing protein n=1 Tax=Halogeometricum sp. CBA1124 TaxID=2668071 RepID=UPI0018D25144
MNRGRERGDDSDVESIAAAEGARADETADAEGVEVLELLDELRTIAQNGVTYAEDPYDRERYERILDLTSEYYGRTLDAPAEEMRGRLRGEAGYVSAKVGASVAVFDDADRILLMRRADGGGWALPGGYVDPNESSSEAAVREAREETGLDVEPVELVGTFDLPAGAGGEPPLRRHRPLPVSRHGRRPAPLPRGHGPRVPRPERNPRGRLVRRQPRVRAPRPGVGARDPVT